MIIIVVTSLNGVLAKKRRKKFSCETINYQQDSNSNVEVKLCARISSMYIKQQGLSKRAARSLQQDILEDISSQRVSNNKRLCPEECAKTVETVYVYQNCSDENGGDDNGGDGCGLDPLEGIDKIFEESSDPNYI